MKIGGETKELVNGKWVAKQKSPRFIVLPTTQMGIAICSIGDSIGSLFVLGGIGFGGGMALSPSVEGITATISLGLFGSLIGATGGSIVAGGVRGLEAMTRFRLAKN